MGLISEFKKFALKGNLVDIAVAFVMGGAFGRVVSTFTEKMIAPLIGILTGGQNFSDKKSSCAMLLSKSMTHPVS